MLTAIFNVTNLTDAVVTGAGSAPGTLRQAIYDANHSSDDNVIEFTAGLHGEINLSVADDQALGPSALVVTSKIAIHGNYDGITIKRDVTSSNMRLFRVAVGADMTLESISLTGAIAQGASGSFGQNGGAGLGGAVYNEGSLHVIASTLYGNFAIGGNAGTGGNGGSGRGGAIYNDAGNVSIDNSTLSGNTVSSGSGSSAVSSFGGAVYSRNGALNIHNSTITLNDATSGRDLYIIGFGAGQTATAEIDSSIIAQADKSVSAFDINATFDNGGSIVVNGGNNLIRSQNAYQSITVSSDPPLLGALADNGGPTLTHSLLADSPAIDQGSNPLPLSTDQRGGLFARTVGVRTDIGAFELQTVAGPALPGDYNGNQVVDAADYVTWRKTQGSNVPQYSGADGNGSGTIDAGDYDVWRGHFAISSSGSGTSVVAAVTPSTFQPAAIPINDAIGAPLDPLGSRLIASKSGFKTVAGVYDPGRITTMPVSQKPATAHVESASNKVGAAPTASLFVDSNPEAVGDRRTRISRSNSAAKEEAHDTALLNVVLDRYRDVISFDSDLPSGQRDSRLVDSSQSPEPLALIDSALNQAILQTPTLAVASICTT